MKEKVFRTAYREENKQTPHPEAFIENLTDFVLQQQLYRAAIKEMRTKLEILDEAFQVRYDHNPIHHIEYRLKTPQSILGKLQKKGLPITTESIWENLTDVAGVRVICNYIDDVYRVAELLLKQDDLTLVRVRNYCLLYTSRLYKRQALTRTSCIARRKNRLNCGKNSASS